MGLLEQEIKELREMNKRLVEGTISSEQVSARIAIYSQTEKRAKMLLQAFAIGAKYGSKTFTKMAKSNLIGDGSCIDIGAEPSTDTVICPLSENQMTRLECLDYSGWSENIEKCEHCEHFGPTRRMLAPTK